MRAAVAAALLIAALTAAEGSAPRAALAMPFNPGDFTAGDACGAPEYASRIGEPYDETMPAALPANARIIRHDMANTLEFTPSRANVLLDERGQVAAIGCY
jgi:hypothetical protein